jgi:glycosyltransferase involved in cell wall biosynthesis
MLGAWRWGSPASVWLAAAARRRGVNVVLLAHELFLPWNKRPDLALGAATLRVQLAILMKLANQVLVTMQMRTEEIAGLSRLVKLARPPGVVRVGAGALPMARKQRPGRFRIGMFSTLASTKRFDVLLDCFAVVRARRPEAELVILGDLGDPNDKRVRTLPLALGAGLPTVSIRSYETDDIFVDGVNILFAPELSGHAFADAVLRISEDPALANRLAAGAQELYREHLSWEKIGDRLLASS